MYVRTELKSGAACYKVQSGDNLSSIATKFYGSASASNVNRIYYSNMTTIGANPNVIQPGQQLYIPD